MHDRHDSITDDKAWKWDFTTLIVLLLVALLLLVVSAEMWWWHPNAPL